MLRKGLCLILAMLCLWTVPAAMAEDDATAFAAAIQRLNDGAYEDAYARFMKLGKYENSIDYALYAEAQMDLAREAWARAAISFDVLADTSFLDSADMARYARGRQAEAAGEYDQAMEYYRGLRVNDSSIRLRDLMLRSISTVTVAPTVPASPFAPVATATPFVMENPNASSTSVFAELLRSAQPTTAPTARSTARPTATPTPVKLSNVRATSVEPRKAMISWSNSVDVKVKWTLTCGDLTLDSGTVNAGATSFRVNRLVPGYQHRLTLTPQDSGKQAVTLTFSPPSADRYSYSGFSLYMWRLCGTKTVSKNLPDAYNSGDYSTLRNMDSSTFQKYARIFCGLDYAYSTRKTIYEEDGCYIIYRDGEPVVYRNIDFGAYEAGWEACIMTIQLNDDAMNAIQVYGNYELALYMGQYLVGTTTFNYR